MKSIHCTPPPRHTHTVTNLRVVNITTNSTTITWDQPPHNYRVFLHGEATDDIPQSRVINETNVTGQTTHVVQGLNSETTALKYIYQQTSEMEVMQQ